MALSNSTRRGRQTLLGDTRTSSQPVALIATGRVNREVAGR